MKKVLALVLCILMVSTSITFVSASAEPTYDFGGQKIILSIYGGRIEQPGIERVFGKINQYFMENYNIDLEILPYSFSQYQQAVGLMLSSGEQVDIFVSGQVGFSTCVSNESCYDLYENDLIQTYGKDILDLVDPAFLAGCTVEGSLYGIPTMRDLAVGMWTIVFDKSYLDGINYDFSKIDLSACNKATFEEMDELFAKLHEAYPDINVIYPWGYQYLNQKFTYDPIGGDNFGVLLDPVNSLEVSDLFESDMFREYCEKMREWYLAGYISKDAATDTTGGGDQIKGGTLMADTTGGKPGIVKQKEVERGGIPSVAFQLGDNFVRAEQASTAAWSINSMTENPEAAMVVLNDFYTNPVVTNLLLWGEEGIDYVFTEDGHVTFPEGVTLETADYYQFTPAWALPCEYTTYVFEGDDIDLWAKTIEFNNNSPKSKAIGFSWDVSPVANEYTALTNVWTEYANGLLLGQIDPEVGIPELQARLKAAGLEKYINAKRTALEAWAAANGIQ